MQVLLDDSISKRSVFTVRVKETEIDTKRQIRHTALCYQGVLGPLPLSFPSLSAHVWQTVGKRQEHRERESKCTAKIPVPAAASP